MKRVLLLIAFLLLAGAASPKSKRGVCPLCECGLKFDKCHKACATDLVQGKICRMQCVDACHHDPITGQCPMPGKPKA